jgi:hypothetical protein
LFTRAEKTAHGLTDDEVPQDTFDYWQDMCEYINDVMTFENQKPIIAEFTPGGYQAYKDLSQWYADLQNDPNTNKIMQSYISKLRIYLARFALLMSFFDHMDINTQQPTFDIEKHHIDRAKRICDYFLATAEEVFIENDERSEADNIDPKRGTKTERIIEMLSKGIKQKVIADKLNCSRQHVSKIKKQVENGDLS